MIGQLLNQVATIYTRRTRASVVGTPSYEYIKTYDNVPCRSVHMKNQFGAFDGRAGSQATHLIYLDSPDLIVDTTMQIEIEGVRYAFEHVDQKYDRNTIHHSECLAFAVESPQKNR